MLTNAIVLYMLCQLQFPSWCKAMIIASLILDTVIFGMKSYAVGKEGN